ncbi:MAG: hypothetical protein E7565_06335 [Ruminococcaceae bacterium]|nr:hypothetical protein [Oscillospiraceae bacterium]
MMKKILAIMLTVILVLSFSVSAFALKSPGGTVYYEVLVNRTNTGENSDVAEKVVVKENGTLELAPVENDDIAFEGWGFYKKNGNAAKIGEDLKIESVTKADGSAAKEGVDYEIKNGKIVSKNNEYLTVEIKPLKDGVMVSELYEGVVPEITPPGTNKPISPSTADFSMAVAGLLFALVVLSGASVVAVKRAR